MSFSSQPHSIAPESAAASDSLQKTYEHDLRFSSSAARNGGTWTMNGADRFMHTVFPASAQIAATVLPPPSWVSGKPAM